MLRWVATYTFTPAPTSTNTSTATFTATSTATFTATQTATNTSTFTPTSTRTPTFTPTQTATSPADLIFKDGFESGNLSAWTTSVTDSGSLSVSASAALTGTQGLSANINDNNSIYVQDDLPNAETRYRARFYFDPNSITMSGGNAHYLLYGYSGTTAVVTRVEFRRASGLYQVRAALISDASTWTTTSWFTISDTPHFIEIDWRASSAAGANSGGLTLWIDGVQQANLTGVDNDTRRIDRATLGAVAGIDTGTRGFEYFDAFESRRTTYIGADTASPTSTPTVTFTASPTSTPTQTVTPVSPTNTPNWTATATSIFSPTPTPTLDAAPVVFSLGLGGSDSVPHQIVRTNADRLYIFVNQQASSVIRVYRMPNPGLPTSAADFASPIQVVESSNPISVDAVYDGGTIIHVLVNLQNGQIKDYPFDTTTNTFKSPITLATDGGTVPSTTYVGTCGVSGMLDQSGNLHIVYWTNGNHIQHRAYIYDALLNVLTPAGAFTQVDSAGSANHPAVAVSPFDNSITIAWVSEATNPAQILARTRASNGTWGNTETVSASPAWISPANGINIDQSPSLLIDLAGVKHLAYIQEFDSAIGDYGRIHYVTNTGSGWVDVPVNALTHDPVLALNSRGEVYLIGHGHPRNSTWGSTCLSMDDMCTIKKNANGTWGVPTLLIARTGTASFDSSPSVKWSVVGFNRPENIEFIFFSTPYDAPVLYYARLP